MQLLVQGKSGQEVADMVNISRSSVHTYSTRIKSKLNLPDLPSLIKFALEHKLVELGLIEFYSLVGNFWGA